MGAVNRAITAGLLSSLILPGMIWAQSGSVETISGNENNTEPANTVGDAAAQVEGLVQSAVTGNTETTDPLAFEVGEEVTEALIEQTDLSDAGGTYIGELLDSRKDIERLEGDNISFIYDHGDRRDPMIIPWVRRAIERRTLLTQAHHLVDSRDFGEALEIFQRLVDEYPGTPEAIEARSVMERIGVVSHGNARDGTATTIVLPMQVREGLTGVIYEPNGAICMIGDDIYEAGDEISEFGVTVHAVKEETVVFLYQGHEFEVKVNSTR